MIIQQDINDIQAEKDSTMFYLSGYITYVNHAHAIFIMMYIRKGALQWRHKERDGVSNNQPHDCLLKRLFRRRSKKTSKLCVTGLCAGNSPVTGEFPTHRASNAANVSIWWRHHVTYCSATPLSHCCFTSSLKLHETAPGLTYNYVCQIRSGDRLGHNFLFSSHYYTDHQTFPNALFPVKTIPIGSYTFYIWKTLIQLVEDSRLPWRRPLNLTWILMPGWLSVKRAVLRRFNQAAVEVRLKDE